ncbi:MAG TPA: alanine--tRNA ligase, partial [Solirubrobacteraceae bacterium]|nr:alanine--tRNA ligase [Solirubrobacteraceae bacterium]
MPMTSDEIRERYLSFFEERDHRRVPSASLVPSAHDPSALLTVAGMHPLKPYFLGQETPPAPRLTSCQKVFRTVDIDNVGNTARHLTFFEMLGNFSFGDYFKREAIAFAWELSREVFGFSERDIWVTVFEGDDGLGLGPDEEAIENWLELGVSSERIVRCPRSENFWQAGPNGPCGPCSELYIDRGVEHGKPDDLPGGENERFLEYWNLVFMQYDQRQSADGQGSTLEPLPARNIDTGLGLNRMAAILQDKRSVFETDQFQPLIALGEELSGRRYGEDDTSDRALRILADHARAMTFLTADGVVPSNEDRGYVLRRVMRRAVQQGRALQLDSGFLTRYSARVRDTMGGSYPELREHAEAIDMWLAAEEEGFGRTLAQGLTTLNEYMERARVAGSVTVGAEDVFRLHDTFGFPYEMTSELLAEEGMSVDGAFEELMEQQRERGRAGARAGGAGGSDVQQARAAASSFAGGSGFETRFTGYETEEQRTTVGALSMLANGDGANGGAPSGEGSSGADSTGGGTRGEGASDGGHAPGARFLVKLAESPFYAAGGGQVADVGTLECERGDCRARVEDVFRVGEDQALAVVVEEGTLSEGERVLARVDRRARHATECNHTATHLLQAALREIVGGHVRQAGSYVGPDKLRFDFSHGQGLGEQELRDVEDRVNELIALNDPVRAITTTLDEARSLGAMALFGEKYGDVVRMVQIGDGECSRELCGGTHVHRTGEIGPFRIVHETSSAANVRRIEALTGPAAVELLREHDRLLGEISSELRARPQDAPQTVAALAKERKRLEKALKQGAGGGGAGGAGAVGGGGVDIDALAAQAEDIDGANVLTASVEAPDAKALLDVVDRVKGRLGEAAILLGTAADGRVHLVASVAPELVQRGVKAGAVVKAAAETVGGGGGGRDTMAQAGGRDPEKLGEAIEAARAAIRTA